MRTNRPKSKIREARALIRQIVKRELSFENRGNGVMLTYVSKLRKKPSEIRTDARRGMYETTLNEAEKRTLGHNREMHAACIIPATAPTPSKTAL